MKKILYVDMDNVLVDFKTGIDRIDPETISEYGNDLDNIPGIFGVMEPMEGAIKAYEELAECFDTYILSTSPWENPTAMSDKLKWVKKHLGKVAYKRLIISHHKNLNKGDYLIDDRENNGAIDFEGELIRFGSSKFPDWSSVVQYLKENDKTS
jgi:5'(3')-deoxyribonucleotidase